MDYYIVSDSPRFVYCIVPKVACTSIKMAIAPVFGIDTTGMEVPREDAQPRYVIHQVFNESPHQIVGKRKLVERLEDYRGHFKFAFVRNPWDRLVSLYADKIAGAGHLIKSAPKGRQGFYKGMPFEEFVEVVGETPDAEANMHFRSQHKVLYARGVPLADFVGRFETLEEDFARVAEKIGADLSLPHVLSSGNRNFRDFYDGRLKDFVAKRYRRDARLFGYSF